MFSVDNVDTSIVGEPYGGRPLNKKYIVRLTNEEREDLARLVSSGKAAAQKIRRANILLKTDAAGPGWTDARIAEAFECRVQTVGNVRQHCVEDGVDIAVSGKPGSRMYARKLDGAGEAHLIALACGEPPDGRACWTLRLLGNALVELEVVDSISHETVRQTLKKTS
jgi:homeodomain-containing protein